MRPPLKSPIGALAAVADSQSGLMTGSTSQGFVECQLVKPVWRPMVCSTCWRSRLEHGSSPAKGSKTGRPWVHRQLQILPSRCMLPRACHPAGITHWGHTLDVSRTIAWDGMCVVLLEQLRHLVLLSWPLHEGSPLPPCPTRTRPGQPGSGRI